MPVVSAVESRLDAAIFAVHGNSCRTGHEIESDDLHVDSIFDEIATTEQSPYYTIYRHLLNNDSKKLVSFIDMWLDEHGDDSEKFPHILRFMAHLVLLLRFTKQTIQEEIADTVILTYVNLLISLKMHSIVPYYASKLPSILAEEVVVGFMSRKFFSEKKKIIFSFSRFPSIYSSYLFIIT
ncbi:unnamed protein product [Gongylonema pulchrum]|uniref:Nuclear pore complex protein n=1 Tax=Gongylonema pulchrum TaxID=637853 RepID=A0A183D124_9BILA|nr:unnamed protein product [Gongylonema pulchrum]